MADINIEEGYQRIHSAFEHVNFNAYDYDSIKESLIEYLQLNYPESFNDYIESSEIISIIEAFAYVGELIAYRVDLNTHENFISQAVRKDSILRLARLIGYTPSRRESSRGMVRIDSVSTSQSIRDSRGIDLKNRVVRWNDASNPNWQEQFFTVMQLFLKQQYGDPFKKEIIDGTNFELYETRITNLTNGVYPYTVTTSQKNIRMELVSGALSLTGPYERTPDEEAPFNMFYRDDHLGLGSIGTGFMMYTVQGELVKNVYNFDQPIPNRKVSLPNEGINNTDVHVIETDGINAKTQLETWNAVDSMLGENLYFNPEKNRKNYEVVSLDDDMVEIHFGDSQFATIPIGPFNIWVRTAEEEPITIPRSKFQQKEFSFTYYDKDGQVQTAAVRFSLVNTLNNASSSEDIERIRSIAPSTYYTQDRMVNSRDYNEFLFQDPSVLKLKSVNRTFSGASKYQKFHDASSNYQNVKLFGDDLRIYMNDGFESQIYSRGEGATEVQLIDEILEDIISQGEVQEHLKKIQGVVSPRTKFREEVTTEFTYTGSSINASQPRPYPERGHDQEKTEIQGRIDGKYYGSLGASLATYPADGLIHTDHNINAYILDFHIPGEARYAGVTFDDLVPGIEVVGASTAAKGTIQSVYPVDSPENIPADYAGYDVTYGFDEAGIPTSIGEIWADDAQVTSGYTILSASTISVSAVSAESIENIELRLPDIAGTHTTSTDTWQFTGADVTDGDVYVDTILLSASNYNITSTTTIDALNSSASALQVVELKYTPVAGVDNGLSGDGTWTEEWQFVGTPKDVIEGDVWIGGSLATAGVDYVIPASTTDIIWANVVAPTTVELKFDDVPGTHLGHEAEWNFTGTQLDVDHAAANIEVDGSAIISAFYTVVNASNILIDASSGQTVDVTYDVNIGSYISGIDRWEFNPGYDFIVDPDFASIYKDDEWVNNATDPYTFTQLDASTANITIEANTIGTTTLEIGYNEVGIMVIEASSTTAALSFNDYEELYFNSDTGNINTNSGIGGIILSQANNLFTYQIQDGSGGGIGSKSLGQHTGAINTGATSNDAFGIGYDRVLDQYYTIAPEDLGPQDAKFSREFARDNTGFNLDNSWLLRVKPIRSGGETQYNVGYRTVELVSYGIAKDFYYQNGRVLQNQGTGLIVEDTFTVLGVNYDILDEYAIGENIKFPVVRQPIDSISGKLDYKRLVIKEFDTDQNGIPDNPDDFDRVVFPFSPDLIMGLDGRGNNLEEGETQVARDTASIYGPAPHTFTFDDSLVVWQEQVDYYGDGAWKIEGAYGLSYPVTDGTAGNPTNIGAGGNLGDSIEYELPAGDAITGDQIVFFDGKEVPSHQYYLNASSIEIAFEAFMGYLTPLGTESLELKPVGIKTELDDTLQLASTVNIPELTDFTIESIMRFDNISGIDIYDGFHYGGYPTDISSIETEDRGWKFSMDASISGSATDTLKFLMGTGTVTDASTWTTVSTELSHTHTSNLNDGLFHHIAVSRSTLIEYEKYAASVYNNISVGDRITDDNGSTAVVWDTGYYDTGTDEGRLWIYDINLAPDATEFGASAISLVTEELLPDGTYGDPSSIGFNIIKPAYRTMRFFVDGIGGSIINLTTDYPDAIDFKPVDTFFHPEVNILSNPRAIDVIPPQETATVYAEGLSVIRSAKYGEDFNDINNPYKKYPRIFPQTVFFNRPDSLSNFEHLTTRPTPTEIVDDLTANTPEKRLIAEFIGRDDLNYLWTHFTPRSNLIDPSKTNIIDMFVHTVGYQNELTEWLGRNDIFEPMPEPPSSNDLKVAYGKYLDKAMLSDTVIMHSGRIKYLFGAQAEPVLRAKFRVVKKEESAVSDEQLKTLVLEVIDEYFDINDWDFGRPFYFTELASEIHSALPKDVQYVALVPSSGSSRFGDLQQITPEDDEILQSAAKATDIEIIAGVTRQNIRRSDD